MAKTWDKAHPSQTLDVAGKQRSLKNFLTKIQKTGDKGKTDSEKAVVVARVPSETETHKSNRTWCLATLWPKGEPCCALQNPHVCSWSQCNRRAFARIRSFKAGSGCPNIRCPTGGVELEMRNWTWPTVHGPRNGKTSWDSRDSFGQEVSMPWEEQTSDPKSQHMLPSLVLVDSRKLRFLGPRASTHIHSPFWYSRRKKIW